MHPEIAQLLSPHIYQELQNHLSVLKCETIKRVLSHLFFVEHDFPEQEIHEGKSHQNPHEAWFAVDLCKIVLVSGLSTFSDRHSHFLYWTAFLSA